MNLNLNISVDKKTPYNTKNSSNHCYLHCFWYVSRIRESKESNWIMPILYIYLKDRVYNIYFSYYLINLELSIRIDVGKNISVYRSVCISEIDNNTSNLVQKKTYRRPLLDQYLLSSKATEARHPNYKCMITIILILIDFRVPFGRLFFWQWRLKTVYLEVRGNANRRAALSTRKP